MFTSVLNSKEFSFRLYKLGYTVSAVFVSSLQLLMRAYTYAHDLDLVILLVEGLYTIDS